MRFNLGLRWAFVSIGAAKMDIENDSENKILGSFDFKVEEFTYY